MHLRTLLVKRTKRSCLQAQKTPAIPERVFPALLFGQSLGTLNREGSRNGRRARIRLPTTD
jgi:hypothetical protein